MERVCSDDNFKALNSRNLTENSSAISREKIQDAKKKILETVEKLLEQSVTEEWLITACTSLSQADYHDVIEERSIINLCGYPLCPKEIKNVKQKYHISVRNNKIYDITERKCFCSNLCYKASNFLKVQLPDCPIWLNENNVSVKLISCVQNSGSAGGEVDIGHTRITKADINRISSDENLNLPTNVVPPYLPDSLENCAKQLKDLTVSEKVTFLIDPDSLDCMLLDSGDRTNHSEDGFNNKNNCALSKISKKTEKAYKISKMTEGKKVPVELGLPTSLKCNGIVERSYDYNSREFSVDYESYESVISDNKYMPLISKNARKCLLIDAVENIPQRKFISETLKINKESLTVVENALTEWISEETFLLLLGKEKFESLWQEFIHQNAEVLNKIESGLNKERFRVMKEAHVNICSKLDREEFMELNCDEQETTVLQSSLEQLPSDVVEIPSGAMYYEEKLSKSVDSSNKSKRSKKKKTKPAERKKNLMEIPPSFCPKQHIAPLCQVIDSQAERINTESFLPLVDSISQTTIRRQLVVDKLKIIYLNILPLIGLHYRNISEDLRNLILSFRLISTNISFKPAEWKMMAMVLFRMLEKISTNQCTYSKEKCWPLLKKTLISFKISIPEIDSILDKVTNQVKLQELWQRGSLKTC